MDTDRQTCSFLADKFSFFGWCRFYRASCGIFYVRLSVTSRGLIKMSKHMNMQATPHDTPGILVFRCQNLFFGNYMWPIVWLFVRSFFVAGVIGQTFVQQFTRFQWTARLRSRSVTAALFCLYGWSTGVLAVTSYGWRRGAHCRVGRRAIYLSFLYCPLLFLLFVPSIRSLN